MELVSLRQHLIISSGAEGQRLKIPQMQSQREKRELGEKGGGGVSAVLNILLGHTAATPQTGFRVACTLKYSSGGEGGGMVGLGGGWGGAGGRGQNRSCGEAEAARREQDKVSQMESELRRKLAF